MTGVLIPLDMISREAREIATYLPWTYGNDALRKIIVLGSGVESIAVDLLVLATSALFFFGVAVSLLRRRM